MLCTQAVVRDRIRTLDGKRVFYLEDGDCLSPAARDFLRQENIAVLPAPQKQEFRTLFGAVLTEKPEHMTHLSGNTLVFKDHPRIVLRGMLDSLQSELLLQQLYAQQQRIPALPDELGEILAAVRGIMRADVLSEPAAPLRLCGMDEAEIHERSHHPERYYHVSHFMPNASDGELQLRLNRLRTQVRQTELAAYRAWRDEDGGCRREDLLRILNRLSSLIWILQIRCKAGVYDRSDTI